jgi:hypothetical protein
VLRYLNNPNPRYRQCVEKDEQDFKRFYVEYFQFVGNQSLRELGDEYYQFAGNLTLRELGLTRRLSPSGRQPVHRLTIRDR